MEVLAFLIIVVWTSLMTYLTFGKGELQTAYPYIHTSARVILMSIIHFFLYFADSQQLMNWAYNVSLCQN